MRCIRQQQCLVVGLVFLSACSPHSEWDTGVTAANHPWFSVSAGSAHEFRRTIATGIIDCESCHLAQAQTFADFTCITCHEHEPNLTQRLHLTVSGYAYQTQSCFACHRQGEKVAFDHGGITGACAQCHAQGAPFDALPANHMAITADCGGCHSTANWKTALGAPTSSFDPAKDVTVTALVPSYAGTSIVKVTPLPQTLHMVMNHASTQVPAGTMGTCAALPRRRRTWWVLPREPPRLAQHQRLCRNRPAARAATAHRARQASWDPWRPIPRECHRPAR